MTKENHGIKAEHPYPYAEGDPGSDERILSVGIERFKQTQDATSKQRAEALEDVLFINGQQWLESITKDRADDRRPALTVNKLPQFVNQVVNDMRKNRPAIKIRPTADQYKDNADVVDGLVRSIMLNGDSKTAIDTASFYQVINGFGYVRILTDYCDDKSFDQIIKLSRIENPFAVYFPVHLIQNLDYSDAPYCFIRSKMSKEDFYRRYPNFETSNYEEQGTGDPNWIGKDYIYVAEYFDVEYSNEKLYLLKNGTTTTKKPEDEKKIDKERDIETKKIKWYLMTQYDILDKKEWPSKYIPIVPVLGQEINENGIKAYISLVRFAKDPQRMYNYLYSTYAEAVALAPRAQWLVAEGQYEDFKTVWQTSNQKNHALLPYKPTSLMGQPVPPPQRINPPDAGSSVIMGIQMATQNLKEVTGIYDASLGAPGQEQSGRAIIARQKEGDNSNYHFSANLSIAMHHVGKILVDMIPVIYDAARTIRIIGEDMTDEVIAINQEQQSEGDYRQGESSDLYDLSVGEYEVMIDVGPNYETKRTETAQNLINVITALPNVGQVVSDILMRQLDFPMSSEAADRLKRVIQQTMPGVIVDNNQADGKMSVSDIQSMVQDIQKLQAMHSQSMQENIQLAQIVNQLKAQLKDKSHQVDTHLQETIIKAQAELEKSKNNNEHDVIMTSLNHGIDLHKMNTQVMSKQQAGLRVQPQTSFGSSYQQEGIPNQQQETQWGQQ